MLAEPKEGPGHLSQVFQWRVFVSAPLQTGLGRLELQGVGHRRYQRRVVLARGSFPDDAAPACRQCDKRFLRWRLEIQPAVWAFSPRRA